MSSVVRYLTPADGAEDDPGFKGKIRVTDDGRISIFDVLACIGFKNPRDAWSKLLKANPDIVSVRDDRKFPGARQRDTPVTDRKGLSKILMLLPGKITAHFRIGLSKRVDRTVPCHDAARSTA